MKGFAYRIPRHVKLDIFPKDIPKLKNGEVINYRDENASENDIPLILFNIKKKVNSINNFSELGFDVRYFPLNASLREVTTCWVKIDESKFEELLGKEWVGTRHDGTNHLYISIYKEVQNEA